MAGTKPLNVAILGTGVIGIDLMTKIDDSPYLTCSLMAGRDGRSPGSREARGLGCEVSDRGIDAVMDHGESFDVVFDATNAMAHQGHWDRLKETDALVIDLTPSKVGMMVVPTVNGRAAPARGNVNLVSCGGQTSIPILHALVREFDIDYIELVTTAASDSVGRATRLNLDEYVETTAAAIQTFTGVEQVRALLNLSPARPPNAFRVALHITSSNATAESVRALVTEVAAEVGRYVPGYRVCGCDVDADGRIFVGVEVESASSRFPSYAGNLDIINNAAIFVAEQRAVPSTADKAAS